MSQTQTYEQQRIIELELALAEASKPPALDCPLCKGEETALVQWRVWKCSACDAKGWVILAYSRKLKKP